MDSVEQIIGCINEMEFQVEPDMIKELGRLLSEFQTEAQPVGPAGSLLKMIQSTQKYLASRGQMAHPDTIPVLFSLSSDLNLLLGDPVSEDQDTQAIISRSIQSFKTLKTKAADIPLVSKTEMEDLKAAILSIDWEISNTTLNNFAQVLSRLKSRFKTTHKIHFSFLSIMYSLGGYIARNKADAHTDALSLLWSVFQNYEHLVAHPDLDPEEKKQMITGDLKSYNAFKLKVSSPSGTAQVSKQKESGVTPALAHVAADASAREMMPLNTLPDPSTTPAPAMPLPEKQNAIPGEVMDDLLSAKESDSPADKLLEEIHLAELHGPGQENSGQLPGPSGSTTKEGITNFTPQKMDREPIPEIQKRLDGFFNLDWSPNMEETPDPGTRETPGDEYVETISALVDSDPSGDPIPDEDIVMVSKADDCPEDDDPDFTALTSGSLTDPILERLNETLDAPENLREEALFTQVKDDLYLLKALGQRDKEKTGLIELLCQLTHYIHEKKDDDKEKPCRTGGEQEDIGTIEQETVHPLSHENGIENPRPTALDKEPEDEEEIRDEEIRDEEIRESAPSETKEQKNMPRGLWTKFTSRFRK